MEQPLGGLGRGQFCCGGLRVPLPPDWRGGRFSVFREIRTPGPLSATAAFVEAFGQSLDRDFAFWSSGTASSVRQVLYPLWKPASEEIRLAPTAPVEASGAEREAWACVDFNPDLRMSGEGYCLRCGRHQDEHARPQPSGETRELMERATAIADDVERGKRPKLEAVDMIRELRSALLSALGGQQGEGLSVEMVARFMAVGAAEVLRLKNDNVTGAGGWASANWKLFAPQAERLRNAMTTPARAEDQDEGAAGEPVAWRCMGVGSSHRWSYFDGTPNPSHLARNVQPLYAHPSPTPAADRVRIAVEALEPFAHIASHVGLPKADTVHVTALDGQWIATVQREDFWKTRQALAALKSTAAKEGGEG